MRAFPFAPALISDHQFMQRSSAADRSCFFMASVKLTDLIDVATLQEIQDGFANLTGMAALTTDENGNAVTKGSNFTDFCMHYTRQSPVGCSRCENCDKSA